MQKIIGVEQVNYVNKNNVTVFGARLHIASPATLPAIGEVTSQIFISGRSISDFPLGDIVTVVYNQTPYGAKPVDVVYPTDLKK